MEKPFLMKHEILFEWYALKAKLKKGIEFYKMWKKWCRTFDNNYEAAFNKHFNE